MNKQWLKKTERCQTNSRKSGKKKSHVFTLTLFSFKLINWLSKPLFNVRSVGCFIDFYTDCSVSVQRSVLLTSFCCVCLAFFCHVQVLIDPDYLFTSGHHVSCPAAPARHGHIAQRRCSLDQSHDPWREPGHRPSRPHR